LSDNCPGRGSRQVKGISNENAIASGVERRACCQRQITIEHVTRERDRCRDGDVSVTAVAVDQQISTSEPEAISRGWKAGQVRKAVGDLSEGTGSLRCSGTKTHIRTKRRLIG
jgi:hypothetical protein